MFHDNTATHWLRQHDSMAFAMAVVLVQHLKNNVVTFSSKLGALYLIHSVLHSHHGKLSEEWKVCAHFSFLVETL